MDIKLIIPYTRIWETPNGYKHVQFFRCVYCDEVLLDKPKTHVLEDCKRLHEYPNHNSSWRPQDSDLVNGHYFERQWFTLNYQKLPDDVVIEYPAMKAQAKLF